MQNINIINQGFNPLQPKTFFPSIFEIEPKRGSYRLPTHRRDAHRNFFHDAFLFLNQNFNNTCNKCRNWDEMG